MSHRHDPTHTRQRIRNSPAPSPTHQCNAQPTPDATRKPPSLTPRYNSKASVPYSLPTLTPIKATLILTLLMTPPPLTTASTPTHILTTLNLNLTRALQALTSNLSPFPTTIHAPNSPPLPLATLNSNPNTNTNKNAFNSHCVCRPSSGRERESLNLMACSYTLPGGQGQGVNGRNAGVGATATAGLGAPLFGRMPGRVQEVKVEGYVM
ncbi:hypothetical protein M422DRAFT_254536 [Sphaerobolus stellatus SS14]|uniref:Uncharacterized protein n=1 Tax=Sphaerobolus stellatus (strain SS14) TaxID=990650 RepID=A0A0C9VVY0_SPHS4|nr:hypothetical protein M422DRAFT_254536 [Sphaerobolus stellatus SS14]